MSSTGDEMAAKNWDLNKNGWKNSILNLARQFWDKISIKVKKLKQRDEVFHKSREMA